MTQKGPIAEGLKGRGHCDSKDLADMFAVVIGEMGHEVHVFYDGPAPLNQIRGIKPHIVFSDISLHEMNGDELVKRLREMPELRTAILVASTGFSRAEDLRYALQADFDYHLVKPILGSQLDASFTELDAGLRGSRTRHTSIAKGHPELADRLRVAGFSRK